MDASVVAEIDDCNVRVRQVGTGLEWSTWLLTQNLTDRWGGLNYNGANDSAVAALHDDPNALERLRKQMWDESTFIVRKDGRFGILFEVEYCSQESEADRKQDDPEWFASLKPHQAVLASVAAALTGMMPNYPGVLFGIPDEDEVVNNRPAAWAFVPDGLLSDEQREALGMSLLSL